MAGREGRFSIPIALEGDAVLRFRIAGQKQKRCKPQCALLRSFGPTFLSSSTDNAYTTACLSEAPSVIMAETSATASVRPEESAPLLSRDVQFRATCHAVMAAWQ
jgi:hypothetical protein